MKIVVIGTRGFPGVQGGVENHCEHIYPYIADLGCDVTVFARKPYMVYENDSYKGIRLIPVSCPRSKFFEAIVHTFKCIMMARKLNPDILHLHAIGPSLFTPLGRLLGMKVIVTHHGPDYMRKKWPLPAKLFLKFCERMGMMFANEIIAISINIADDIRKKFNREVTILPNGIEIPNMTSSEKIIKKFELEKRKYILAVGRLVPEKGFHDLIEAFSRWGFDSYKLVIVGDADHEDNYSRSLKIKASKYENIVLTGFLPADSLQEFFNNAALFVLPSYYEGLPIALLEALSYGIPCIASNIPANRNIEMDDEKYFKVGDIDDIVNAINKNIALKWDDLEMSKQKKNIYEQYNWRKIAEDTLGIYERL